MAGLPPHVGNLRLTAGLLLILLAVIAAACTAGCGTTAQRTGTEQLLMSDAVDQAISQLDFRVLSGRKVHLNTAYILQVKGAGFVNAEYIISSLRQQLMAAHCYLQERPDDAEVIVEPRVGALGNDMHQITYGLPPTNSIAQASTAVTGVPLLPPLPELSIAKIESQMGIAKLYVFAYERESREPIWQSGLARSSSSSRNTWILGAGPVQRGSVYDGVHFAGRRVRNGWYREDEEEETVGFVVYDSEHHFIKPSDLRRKMRMAELPPIDLVPIEAPVLNPASPATGSLGDEGGGQEE